MDRALSSISPVLAIVGPTATGKTSLAIEVAHRRGGGEIISMDSRQAYRGFGIGTAAPSESECAAIRHHGVGTIDPTERYGAGRFVRDFDRWRREIEDRGAGPILVGGTGLFLRALTHPLFQEPDLDSDRRDRLGAWLETVGADEVSRWAARLDPRLVGSSSAVDQQRASRTIELVLLTGAPLSWWRTHGKTERSPLQTRTYVLKLESDAHRARIRRRAETTLTAGAWQEEVRVLMEQGLERSHAFDALGYADVAALVREEIDLGEALERIVAATWQYARRQRTWFRHQLPEGHVVLDASSATEQLAGRIIEDWDTREGRVG